MNKTRSFSSFSYVATAFVAVVGVLLITIMGSVSYNSITKSRDASDNLRGTVSYIRTQIRAQDKYRAVSIRDGMLILSESDGTYTYEQRIYAFGGYLMEEYALAESPQNPENAEQVLKLDTFEVEYVLDGLIRVNTEYGSGFVRVYCGGER